MKNQKKHLLATGLLFYFILLNCNDTTSHEPFPLDRISGKVIDSITGLAIDSAEVIFGDTLSSTINTYSNSEGLYFIYPGTTGVVNIYCRKENYVTKMKSLDLPYDNLIITDFNFELTK